MDADSGAGIVPDATVDAVIARVRAAPPRLSGGRLLCIDGPAGSGKSTLARAVTAALVVGGHGNAATAHLLTMDDHYEGWSGLGDADRRIRDDILEPLAAGEPGFYRRYDWHDGAFAELHVVAPVDVLVLEGVGSGSSLLAPYRSVLVWVSAPDDVRLARGLARDGAAARPHWERWMVGERAHFAAHGTEAAADLYVGPDGRLVTPPDGGS
ncbi:uridine kinase [Nocardioides sp.]|uniref:uridine kinase family protein n=1 Tax=Nocardioides sp. TaxID=35761 RepID=UPI002733D359|nr:4-amino-4-deoxy-L-arabinose transferase [Nocardioides sp.]MDP3892217.1 4-amino-4-deoxy-L-arabinose transferase [Nocardioides sp.]